LCRYDKEFKGVGEVMQGVIYGIENVYSLFFFLLILRIFLTWIPNIDWGKNPWLTLTQVTDWYLNLFRRFIPPIGMIDWSPIIALFVLSFLKEFLIFTLKQFAGGF
jgi:YggT family protein